MKKVNFFAMLAAAALMSGVSSCSNDDNVGDDMITPGQSAKLSVNVVAPPMSRAHSVNVPTDAVGNFTVFITDKGTGDINSAWTTYSSSGASLTGNDAINVTTNAENVYIVANAGNLNTITSLNGTGGLNAYLADLNGTGSQTAVRWATGKTASAISFTQTGSDFEASTSVALTFIAARITVRVENLMTNTSDPNALSLDNIAVLNARGESLLFPNATVGPLQGTLIPNAYTADLKFYEGLANPAAPGAFANYPAAGEFTVETGGLLSDALTDLATDTYYYYVFENNATASTDFPTIITLIGEDANGKALYWPVHLTANEQWSSGSTFTTTGVERGNSYDITIKLTGDATNGGGGTTDPTLPVTTASIEVSVTLTQWTPITLEKEF